MRLLTLFVLFAVSFTILNQSTSAQNRTRIKRLDGSTITTVEIESRNAETANSNLFQSPIPNAQNRNDGRKSQDQIGVRVRLGLVSITR